MTLEEKVDRWFKEKYGNEGFTDIEEEIRKICFEDGYKECEKEQKECQDFIWESVGFKKRGFVNSIQIAEYIDKLEKENAELKKKIGIYQIGMYDEIEKRDKKLTNAKDILKEAQGYIENEDDELYDKINEFIEK